MRVARLLAAWAIPAIACAQSCPRPTPPPGGHPANVDLVVPVTYSDGYQTFASLIRPAGPAPTCGWPLVVHVHPLGQSRGFDLDLQQWIAGQGYAVWSYDVRAHGQAATSNLQHPHGGTTLWGPEERLDLAEQIQFVAAQPQWTGIVDATRIGVVGSSMGGAHAWIAAALSGKPLAVPGRPATTFPTIACVAPSDFVGETVDDWLRGGVLFSSWFLEAASGSYAGLQWDPTFLQTCGNAFVAQDPAALLAAFVAEGRPIAADLATSTVPILYRHGYCDSIDSPLNALLRLEPRTSPYRVLLGANGHNGVANDRERERGRALLLRWLHRWLWAEANEVELEPAFLMPEVPLRQLDRDDALFAWSHASRASVAPPATAMRLWLHDDFALRDVAPVTPQVDAVLLQAIDPQATTFTPADYLAQPAVRALANVLTVCPLHELVYTFTTTAETQLVASPVVHLQLEPQHADWMLAALLTVQSSAPGEGEVLLASQGVASRTSQPGVPEQHDLRLPPVATRLPAGTTVRLRLRNLWLQEAPHLVGLEVAPLFHDFQVDIVHGDVAGSWLELPLEPVAPRLVVDTASLDLAAPVPVQATLRGGSARAGYPYFAAIGISGQLPGAPYLNDVVPIDGDWLVVYSAGSSEPPFFSGFLGFLDGEGNAGIGLDFSSVVLPQILNGYSLTMAAFVWDGPWAASGAAANACDVLLR